MGFAKWILFVLAKGVKFAFMPCTLVCSPQCYGQQLVIVSGKMPGTKIEEAHEVLDAEELQAAAGA